MDEMRYLLAGLGLAAMSMAQVQPKAQTGNAPAAEQRVSNQQPASPGSTGSPAGMAPVRFSNNGWPVGFEDTSPAPAVETKPLDSRPVSHPAGNRAAGSENGEVRQQVGSGATQPYASTGEAIAGNGDVLVAAATADEPLASGMQMDSPMHDVFRATRSPGALHAIGGVEVFWRLTIHGTHGEIIGIRDITHIADCSFPERDRLEDTKGRVFTRDGQQIGAQRNGIPYDSLQADAKAMLELFGLQLRMPWCFGEGRSYAVMAREAANRRGEMLVKLQLQRRPPADQIVFGPEAKPTARDQFELLFEPSTGQPRELLHRFVSSGQQRRVLLDDWQEEHGVRMPRRRIYVDDAGRATTTLELRRITPRRVSEREFRQL